MSAPLEGIRILDLSSVVMGPYATQILGDMGAEVIVVEGTKLETNRVMGRGSHPELSGVALNLMRNKRSVHLDFKDPSGRQAVLDIGATCDVVVTNLRPGALKRSGLTYEDFKALRQDIIYCEAHGYASDGPRAEDPAYDDVIQAGTGVADANLLQNGAPALVPTIFADKTCGLSIVYAVCAALFSRERTGQGQRVEVPMADTATAFVLVEHGAEAIPQPPVGPAGYARILAPSRRPQATADGWIHILPYSKAHYEAVLGVTGLLDDVDPALYETGRARIANAEQLYQLVHKAMKTRTTDEWMTFLTANNVPATRVNSLQTLVDALPTAEHPVAGSYKQIPPPVRFGLTPQSVRRHAPVVGEHTDEVLSELGYSKEDLDQLRRSGGIPAEAHDR